MRILFVAMSNSVHTARWIGQLADRGWDLHLFPAYGTKPHPGLSGITIHDGEHIRPERGVSKAFHQLVKHRGGTKIADWLGVLFPQRMERSWRLARLIKKLKPDIVHSMQMQYSGYLTLAAKRWMPRESFPAWIYSCWGNDIYLCGKQSEHVEQIRSVLDQCDYLTTDCARDAKLAGEFGFRGNYLGEFLAPGGYDLGSISQYRTPAPIASRRTIVVKGYQSDMWGGRALVALQGIHRCEDALRSYEIVVCPVFDPVVRSVIQHIASVSELNIKAIPGISHDAWMQLMGRARIYIGLSFSDGTPCTMVEAMIMGTFPIQSDTVSTGEWIKHGENGLLVPPEDSVAVEAAIRRAVADDTLVEKAAVINARMMQERVDTSVVKPRVIGMYERVLADANRRRSSL